MNIFITEEQFNRIIKEGINYNKNGVWNVDVNIDSDQRDVGNVGFDTRLFGKANDILNGDGTRKKKGGSKSFKDEQEQSASYIKFLNDLKVWVENGRKGMAPEVPSTLGSVSASAIKRNLSLNDDKLIEWIESTLSRISVSRQVRANKYDRAISANQNDKIARYNVGVVPGTNIKVICLFDFDDFNVSDVLKNGYMRQNKTTDGIFDISKERRPMNPSIKGKATLRTVPVTYDGQTPSIRGNFSLNGIEGDNDHFNRVSYGLSDNSYNSVSKFIDKSINYAQYALKQENVQADYILCAPSSSKFNIYYSKRLQDKTGIPFINGFFTKKLVNVHFDRQRMEREGISEETINKFESDIKSAAMKEISDAIALPLKNFVNNNWNLFENVSFDLYKPSFRGRRPKVERPEEIKYAAMSNSKVQKNQVYQIVATQAYDSLKSMILSPGSRFDDNTSRVILNNLERQFVSSVFNAEKLIKNVNSIISNNCLQEFTMAVRQMAWLVATYHKQLLDGFYPNFGSKGFKVTGFPKNTRKFLKGAFVIADAQLNKDKELFSRYAGKKYLIFDEDMNSGATLAMLGDALMDYGIKEQDIVCLVNGFSPGGF